MKSALLVTGNDDAPGDLAQLYECHAPMLAAAVAAMAQKGMDVNPADGLDLVHDFYIEALDGIMARYDPSRAKISTYLYKAFVYFVSKRIARQERWKDLLLPLDEAIAQSPVEAVWPGDDRWRLAQTLQRIPPELRDILQARLADRESEREIAASLGVSRRFVRDRLGEALGRLAIAMDRDDMIRADLRPLAVRLWRDEATLTQVAVELNLSRREVWKRFKELVRAMGAAAEALEAALSLRERTNHERTVPRLG
jgi:RNA polymerase sigma factor (sigma-70 family)